MQLSLGDSRSFYLGTAHNQLGVVYAISAAGSVIELTFRETDAPGQLDRDDLRGNEAKGKKKSRETNELDLFVYFVFGVADYNDCLPR